jgi:NADP-dependent 3-hydroxy acid dehydrogenase YdfG
LLILGKEFCWKMIFTLKKELSPEHNIRVTCIESGAVSTELLETITDESME